MMVTVPRNPHQTRPTGTISTPTALTGLSELGLGRGGGVVVMKAGKGVRESPGTVDKR